MKEVVSFYRAKTMKEMGFTQPLFMVGDIWFDLNGKPTVVKFHSNKNNLVYYAPDALDILRDMPGISLTRSNGRWVASDNSMEIVGEHESNSAVAVSDVWIELKKRIILQNIEINESNHGNRKWE